MHEATIAQSILKIAATKLEETGPAASALKICIKVGQFRNVDEDSLNFAFDNLKGLYRGFGACQLESQCIKTQAWCRRSHHRYNPCFENAFCCEQCGSGIGEIICGEELDFVELITEAT
jgi:Zn finger protein HypA/HybF involved in hydrogenase expression